MVTNKNNTTNRQYLPFLHYEYIIHHHHQQLVIVQCWVDHSLEKRYQLTKQLLSNKINVAFRSPYSNENNKPSALAICTIRTHQ